MKRSSTISFTLKSKRKCELQLNNLRSKFGLPCFSTDEDDSHGIPILANSIAIEDTVTICERLKSEGNTLAENSRFWEALSKFKGAIELQLDKENNSDNIHRNGTQSSTLLSILHELCSQCFTELGEIYPAVESAEKAVNYNRTCNIALQTLARAQVNIGELYLAKKYIQRSLHVNPSCSDSWDDLKHILELIKKLESSSWSGLPIETRPGIVCQR
jgi:tetratricopeptide (TPR) repeat protein